MTKAGLHALALVVLVLCGTASTWAYPKLWAEENAVCGAHPTGPAGDHKAPVPDRTAKFVVTGPAGAPVTAVCPGAKHTVKVAFPEPRLALITTNVGSFDPPSGADASCPNRYYLNQKAEGTSLTTAWVVPCTAKGSAELKVTSATGPTSAFMDSSATLPVNPACAAATCAGAAAAAAPKAAAAAPTAAAPAAKAAPAATKAAAAVPAAAAAAAPAVAKAAGPAPAATKAAAAVPGCTPSALGYSCVAITQDNTKIHYSYGPSPPDNVCTRGAADPVNATNTPMAHFLYEGGDAGWAAAGFPHKAGAMYPADVVLGWVNPDGTAKVSSYHLQDYDCGADDSTKGWAYNMGVAKTGGQTMVCFSRALDAPAAVASPSLTTAAAIPMIWASSDQSRLVQHNLFGSQSADLRALIAAASGNAAAAAAFAQQAAAAEAADNAAAAAKRARSERARIAHGALMLAAFVLLMPTGVLLSRHKWTFGDQAASKIKPGWFHLHIGVQSLAVLTAIASIILIFAVFGTGRQGVDDVYTPHMGLGIFAVAAAAIQGAIGKFRPGITDAKRTGWRALHYGWGWIVVLAGIANCAIGIDLINSLQGDAIANWVAPAAAVLGLIVVAGIALELRRTQLVRNGSYDPKTHAYQAPSSATDKLMAYRSNNTSNNGNSGNGYNNGNSSYP